MAAEATLTLAGATVIASGQRALYWPMGAALMIADLHLGKADVFRRAGIPVPTGGTADDLRRLHAVVQSSRCQQLWILGDMLHGPLRDAAWLQQWLGWRRTHASLDVHLLRGNHDRRVDATALEVTVHEGSIGLGPFQLRHEPETASSNTQRHSEADHVICGHLHPQAALNGMTRRWPAFWMRHGLTVLPAFSGFTAGVRPCLQRGDQLLACVEGCVVALPPAP